MALISYRSETNTHGMAVKADSSETNTSTPVLLPGLISVQNPGCSYLEVPVLFTIFTQLSVCHLGTLYWLLN